ncbi:MAG: SDR family NAD(P)-dependent oxidoreductase, partial [bacterium]
MHVEQYDFGGKVAVVTGASRGIGKAVVNALSKKGCIVAGIARPSEALDQLTKLQQGQGYKFNKFECDLSHAADTQQLIERLLSRYDRIDIVVNCAGVGKFGPFGSLSSNETRAPLEVPLLAAVSLCHGLLPAMVNRCTSRIVNITGPAAYFDLPYMAAYTASRAGLLSFSRALDRELRPDGVRVRSVCPAWVDTEYIERNQTDGDWLPAVSRYFPTISADQAAQYVIDAISGNRSEIKPSWLLRTCALSYRWFPRLSVNAFKLLGLYRPPALAKITKNQPGASKWTNWEESIELHPIKVTFPKSLEDVSEVLANPQDYPSPVRAAGSRHTTTHCGVADHGTLMIMRKLNRIIEINAAEQTVTVEAGAIYIDVAGALKQKGFQFYVNVEIGNLTMGSAASTGTKDASMPGEFGQVCSYCVGVKMVLADGTVREVNESEPELLQVVRSSYGMLGVIVETTFKIQPLRPMSVRHKTYTLDEFEKELPVLQERNESIMYYLFPFQDVLTVEFRSYLNQDHRSFNRWLWPSRNLFWKTIAPTWGYSTRKLITNQKVRSGLLDGFYGIIRVLLNTVLRSRRTCATDQIIRYPEHKNFAKYTFSIWAFREQEIMPTMRAYYVFCKEYYRKHGFRCDMLNVGYRISEDRNPLFSYS